jgi:hypothetical protein
MGLALAVAGVLAVTVGVATFAIRAPRCPGCGRPGVGEARAIADTQPSLVELIYRCRPCDLIVGRRTLGHPGE